MWASQVRPQRGASLIRRPALDYRDIGRLLDMPVGSIGPIRMRCLERLRGHGALQALEAAGA